MTPAGLAWRNLAHKRGRTAVAAAGVAFAVVLVFMELGLYGGVSRTATQLYDVLRFDLLLTSSEYVDIGRTSEFPRGRLAQARGAAGVRDVLPLSIGVGSWWMPAGGLRSINLLGAPPDRLADLFALPRVFPDPAAAQAAGAALGGPDAVLFDVRSKPEFGRAADLLAGAHTLRFSGRQVNVAGTFNLGTGFSWNALLLTTEERFAALTFRPLDRVCFGLIQLDPAADPAAVQATLRATLPSDVQVLTRGEMEARERRHWLRLTSIGQFLLVAVVLAVVVGVIFVYQMMAADIRAMLPEYATVKALGYRPPYLTGVVLAQAAFLAGLGFAPGFAATFGLYALARDVGGIPTEMSAERAVLVLALTTGMCLASGLLAVRKVHLADPADLFA